ncbi:hypothetical protein NZ698_12950 [Chryseobacterium sp. PBS4-4]|uniref:Trm112 family protein n=1 Tax=Chryseobacterium edaphi TaxID=2976532 RepID=A0ABT2W7B7_9FLAO|nr:Trm112 family protein [Chryseobacterium edaphi]MCU7618111.1 hypothetical protein [Chryseobacterium edaphi]
MRIKTIEKLCCPFDKSDLNLTIISQDETENIMEGLLVCDNCKRVYPIISGIPIMSPDEYREFKLEQPVLERWEKHLEGKKVENFRLIS